MPRSHRRCYQYPERTSKTLFGGTLSIHYVYHMRIYPMPHTVSSSSLVPPPYVPMREIILFSLRRCYNVIYLWPSEWQIHINMYHISRSYTTRIRSAATSNTTIFVVCFFTIRRHFHLHMHPPYHCTYWTVLGRLTICMENIRRNTINQQ